MHAHTHIIYSINFFIFMFSTIFAPYRPKAYLLLVSGAKCVKCKSRSLYSCVHLCHYIRGLSISGCITLNPKPCLHLEGEVFCCLGTVVSVSQWGSPCEYHYVPFNRQKWHIFLVCQYLSLAALTCRAWKCLFIDYRAESGIITNFVST